MIFLAAWTLLASLFTFFLFAADKARARRGAFRIPERRLHLASLCGGWAGGLSAIYLIRHKTRKAGFLAVQWLIAGLHIAVWAAVIALR